MNLTPILTYIEENWHQHAVIATSSIWLFIEGLNWRGIISTLIAGVLLFIITSQLKRWCPKWFK